jgi:hypothetical protein
MFALIWLFWYCFDDWTAQVAGNPNIGTVPFFLWFIILLVLCALSDLKITIKT